MFYTLLPLLSPNDVLPIWMGSLERPPTIGSKPMSGQSLMWPPARSVSADTRGLGIVSASNATSSVLPFLPVFTISYYSDYALSSNGWTTGLRRRPSGEGDEH